MTGRLGGFMRYYASRNLKRTKYKVKYCLTGLYEK